MQAHPLAWHPQHHQALSSRHHRERNFHRRCWRHGHRHRWMHGHRCWKHGHQQGHHYHYHHHCHCHCPAHCYQRWRWRWSGDRLQLGVGRLARVPLPESLLRHATHSRTQKPSTATTANDGTRDATPAAVRPPRWHRHHRGIAMRHTRVPLELGSAGTASPAASTTQPFCPSPAAEHAPTWRLACTVQAGGPVPWTTAATRHV